LNKVNGECIKNENKNVKCKTYSVNGTTKTCVECYTNDILDKAGFSNKVESSVFDSGSEPDETKVC